MTTLSKSEYNQALKNGICTVVFRKKDGTNRTMTCTLQQEFLEKSGLIPVGGGAVVPDTQVRCVDTEIMQWRSFNIDSVIKFA
jgi:hypothetical protein